MKWNKITCKSAADCWNKIFPNKKKTQTNAFAVWALHDAGPSSKTTNFFTFISFSIYFFSLRKKIVHIFNKHKYLRFAVHQLVKIDFIGFCDRRITGCFSHNSFFFLFVYFPNIYSSPIEKKALFMLLLCLFLFTARTVRFIIYVQ